MDNATALQTVNVAGRTNVAAPLSDRDAAERFSLVIVEFSAGDLAKAARRTKAAAKGWKDASRCPSGASLLNMAASLPAVWKWIAEESGRGMRDAQALSADAVIRWAHEARNAPGLDGQIARAVLHGVVGDHETFRPNAGNEASARPLPSGPVHASEVVSSPTDATPLAGSAPLSAPGSFREGIK